MRKLENEDQGQDLGVDEEAQSVRCGQCYQSRPTENDHQCCRLDLLFLALDP